MFDIPETKGKPCWLQVREAAERAEIHKERAEAFMAAFLLCVIIGLFWVATLIYYAARGHYLEF